MLIGELATRSGVPAKTLRYYEEIGLLPPPSRSSSGYRDYNEDVFDRLDFIKPAQALGLSLGEIRSIIAMRDGGDMPCAHVLELMRTRTAEIDRTIRKLRAVKADLQVLIERGASLDPADCDPNRVCHIIEPASRSSG